MRIGNENEADLWSDGQMVRLVFPLQGLTGHVMTSWRLSLLTAGQHLGSKVHQEMVVNSWYHVKGEL